MSGGERRQGAVSTAGGRVGGGESAGRGETYTMAVAAPAAATTPTVVQNHQRVTIEGF